MDLLTIIAAAFALGIALDKTGAASSIAGMNASTVWQYNIF